LWLESRASPARMDPSTEVTTVPRLRASRIRYRVLAFVCSLSVITYLDRVGISQCAPYITLDLGLTPSQMGLVFMAFGIAYAAFEVPSGWLGDVIGPRKVLTRIVVWWSAFTTLTGLVHHLWGMLAVRFMFGVGEAGAFPNTTKVISRWVPTAERGFAQGMVWMFARLGGAFAPGLVAYLIAYMSWRPTFWIFGGIGIVWAALFWFWFRDMPRQKSGVNEAEAEIIEGGQAPTSPAAHLRAPWSCLVASGNLWAICWMYFCMSYGWYFYVTWLPTYLKARGASTMQAGVYAGMPLFFGAIGCVLGGFLTDYAVKRSGSLGTRRYIGFLGFFVGSICMLGGAWLKSPLAAVLSMSAASFFGDLTMPSCWAVCLDVGHEFAGTVSGCMNTWGNVGGALSPLVAGLIVQHTGNWNLPIVLSSGIFFLGALLWVRIDPTRSVLE
jgi:MFS family permease